MDVCFIAPIPKLEEYATASTHHLVLAHIYEQDETYRAFYRERVRQGDFVILDNSAYELQESVNVQRLLTCAEDLNPTAVFLPDSRFNTKRTIELAKEAKEVLGGKGWKLFGVPQGKDLSSILECYHWLGEQDWIDGFGFYEEIGEVAGMACRNDFLRYIEENDYIWGDKYYHLLGMEEDLTQIAKLAKHGWVNSIDSVKAIVYGLNTILLTPRGTDVPYPHRPKDYFQKEPDELLDIIIRSNMRQVLEWAQSS